MNPRQFIESNNDAAGSSQTTPIVWIVLFETSRQFIFGPRATESHTQ